MDNAWRALLTEAECSAAVMKELELVLHKEVRETLLKWKKQNYPRFLGRSKVARKASSDFEKARKYVFLRSCRLTDQALREGPWRGAEEKSLLFSAGLQSPRYYITFFLKCILCVWCVFVVFVVLIRRLGDTHQPSKAVHHADLGR